MRFLVWLTALAALLYGGYWYVGSRAVLGSAEAALTQLKAEGRGDYSGIELHGFPSRFDVTIKEPRLFGANGRMGWQAPFVQVLALSYQPNHVIAVWPHDQTLTLGPERMGLTSSDLRASAAFAASLSLPLQHAEMEGHDLVLSGGDWSVLATKMILAARQSASQPAGQEVALVLTGLAPGDALRARIDPTGQQPALVDTAELDLTPVFDRPVDRSVLASPLRLTALRTIDGKFHWGQLGLDVQGDLAADAQGFAEGKLSLTARNWRGIYALAQSAGAIPLQIAKPLQNILAALEKGSGEAGVVKLPLRFKAGQTFVGPIALGPAPRF